MIATCTNCPARYELEDAKIPNKIIQVRCPSCDGVFALDGTQAIVTEDVAPPVAAQDVPEPLETTSFDSPPPAVQEYHEIPDPVVDTPVAAAAVQPEPVMSPEPAAAVGVATLDEPSPSAAPGRRRRRCKEEMLARALVSDILVYNRDMRDTGLAEGNLLEVLGGEIKKSWELYKEKVTPEVANSTTYFREALNEILADGESVF